MGVINQVIPNRRFELIRDRIGAILKEELIFQSIYEEELDASVWIERVVKFDHTEMPALNVMLSKGNFSGQDTIKTDGTYWFTIDGYTKASSSPGVNGDSLAVLRLHRLLGVVQAILEDPRYSTLGFAPPFISNRHVEEMIIAEPEQAQDMYSIAYGRLLFSVRTSEATFPTVPKMIAGNTTTVQLQSTDKGYLYVYDA